MNKMEAKADYNNPTVQNSRSIQMTWEETVYVALKIAIMIR